MILFPNLFSQNCPFISVFSELDPVDLVKNADGNNS